MSWACYLAGADILFGISGSDVIYTGGEMDDSLRGDDGANLLCGQTWLLRGFVAQIV